MPRISNQHLKIPKNETLVFSVWHEFHFASFFFFCNSTLCIRISSQFI
uniref:Uncharacterized protein n=1 Tax=Arundo donax TaxID=35708 RepID=A0A0A9HTR0_ARUDO